MEKAKAEEIAARPTTAPINIPVCVRAFDTVEQATNFAYLLVEYVRELGRYLNLERLDGLTVAHDYAQALLELDRGYKTPYRLVPTSANGIGVAMTPSVIRDSTIKSHIVFNAAFIQPLGDQNNELFSQALHLLAHECAHVDVTCAFDKAFPGTLLQKPVKNIKDDLRSQIITATWDEFAATWLSANIGSNPINGYEETFLAALSSTRNKANDIISAYRHHHDVGRIATDVYGVYGALIKFAAYLLGTMHGQNLVINDLPKTKEALQGHWFASYFDNLFQLLKEISKNYGQWSSFQPFETIGSIAENIIAENGLTISYMAGDQCYVDVPF